MRPQQDTALAELEEEIRRGLAVPADHPVWVAVNKLLDYQISMEHLAAQEPGLQDHERQYQVGRDASLENFKHALGRIFNKGRTVKTGLVHDPREEVDAS